MESITTHISLYLTKTTVWIKVALILACSYVFMHLSQLVGPTNYGLWIIGFSIFSLPVLIFDLFHKKNRDQANLKTKALWILVYLAYPIILTLFKLDLRNLDFISEIFNVDIQGEFSYSVLAILYLLLEVLFFLVREKEMGFSNIQLKNKKYLLRIGFITLFLFSALLVSMSHYFELLIEGKKSFEYLSLFLYYVIQFFIIYGSYYIYYHIHHHILFSGLLKKKGILYYLFGLVVVIMLVVPIHNFFISLFPIVSDLKLHTLGVAPQIFDDLNYSLPIFILTLSFPLIVVIEWYKQANALNVLEEQKSKNELNLLKHQLNPHFFFNTLNNLYSMSLTQEKETPETILQLSELMRYVIYKGKEDKVLLADEVKYIEDYISLQLIRIHNKVDYKFDISLEDHTTQIPPLLFIILIENAFKHGIEPAPNKSMLHINLYQKENELVFECTNSIEILNTNQSHGIGLKNLQKRLEILYPSRHNLNLQESNNHFKATLKIQL